MNNSNNNNRRGPQNRQHNRSRNRPTTNRSNQQQRDRNYQPPRSQAYIQSDSAQRPAPITPTSSGLSQQHQQSPYSKVYQSQSQNQPSSSTSSDANQTQDHHDSAGKNLQASVPLVSDYQSLYAPSALDGQADALYSDVHGSLSRAIDCSYNMPISEHVLYSSYESYDNIMMEQRRQLDEMMSQLSKCALAPSMPQYYAHGSTPLAADNFYAQCTDYGAIEDMHDKYDSIHEFSEQMYDRIGQNLDDAAGLRMRDAQLVQATLRAASQNKLTATTSQITTQAHPQYQQQVHLSSGHSSSSLTTRPSEISSPSSSVYNAQQVGDSEYQAQYPNRNQQTRAVRSNDSRVTGNQQSNIVYPVSMQNQYQSRNQYGGYMGKQQYGSSHYQRFSARENKNIPRPQDSFRDEIDNSYKPFEPPIKEKPNALIPLNLSIEMDEQGNEFYSHPYEYEIRHFEVSGDVLAYRPPIEPIDFDSTPLVLVETVEQLEEMCRTIEKEREIAVDVEHHSYRSYQGITCLLQISTRTQDFVIDTIKLRSELQRLNCSFTNPDIVKVFHGADCDILWLQRDFGVYVVNLFDTSRAAKLMKFAHLSLAFLMKHYCNVETDKSYQLADWRERPLPLPMIRYARADTHFLLYIYDRLRNDILEKDKSNEQAGVNILRSVFTRCKELCLKRYEKPPYSEKNHLSILRKYKTTFNAKQMYAFKEMYQWRDKISRKLDESVGYVLPNNLMIRIAEYLPREPQGITALCNPVPPTLKKYLNDVHAIILRAIEVPLDEASKVLSSGNPLNIDPSLRSIDLDSINHKQDVAHSAGLHEGEVHGILDMFYQLNCDDSFSNHQHPYYDRVQGYQQYGNQYDQINYANYMNNLNQSSSRLYNFLESSPNEKHHQNSGSFHQSIQRQFVSPYSRYEDRSK